MVLFVRTPSVDLAPELLLLCFFCAGACTPNSPARRAVLCLVVLACPQTMTEGVVTNNWKSMIADIVRDPSFYQDHYYDDDGERQEKPVGWDFLKAELEESEEEEEESEFSIEEESDAEEVPKPGRVGERGGQAGQSG